MYKQFVVDCYEHGKFKSSDAYVPSNIDDFSAETSSKKASIKPPAKPSTAAAYRPARPAPAVVPQTTSTNSLVGQSSEGSLIDFFSDAAVAGTPTSTAGSTLSTFDPFGDSSYTPSPTPMNGQPLSQNQSFDSSTSAAYKTSATASSAFDPFGDDFGDFNSAANKPSISDELLSSFNQGLFLSDPNSIVNSGSNTSSVVASQNSATTSAASVFDFMPTAVLTPVSSSSSLSSSSPVVPQGPPQQGYNPSGMGANSYGGQPSSMLSSQMARGMGVGIMGGPQYTYHQQNQTRNGYNAAYGGMGNGMYPQAGVANGSGMRPMGVQPVGVNGYKNSSMSISQLPMPGQEHTVLTNNQAGGSKGSFNFVQDTIKSQLNNNRR